MENTYFSLGKSLLKMYQGRRFAGYESVVSVHQSSHYEAMRPYNETVPAPACRTDLMMVDLSGNSGA